ncbi:sulfatase [Waterburya agarophytonicola K14]|uniref:Sulfatase n=1 Tax=Waterburya agarophytonicola KI4 TaxID=2874699 RepID=A0A964BU71_9CYAN|nr:sulfatase [Waterburya agarophytonicola]MCC0178306.1 sulfatase [Waterburya agarophytonicola KI4]
MIFSLMGLIIMALAIKGNLAKAQATPNILFILTDDLDAAAVEYMPQVKSLIADQGISFSNYFVNISLCCPSRASILRGQYAHNTGVFTNNKADGSFIYLYQQGLEKSTIATWLKDRDYLTAFMGKYLNGYPRHAPEDYVPPGWDEWYSPIYDSGYVGYNYRLNENGKLVRYGRRPKDYSTDVYTEKARQFIDRAAQANQPFFAYVSYFAPHQPAIPAPRHSKLFKDKQAPRTASFNEADVRDKPTYIRHLPLLNSEAQAEIDQLYQRRLKSLQAVDEGVASLIATLKANGQLDNTYIVFSSDNGFRLGQHRLPPAKETAYEEDIHLPLYIRGPGVAAGRVIKDIVSNVDLAPTFAELAEIKTPKFVDGRSLVGLMRSQFRLPWRQVFLLEHRRDKPAALIPSYTGLRTKNCTYVKYGNGEQELYNVVQDPQQLENIASRAARIIKQYSQRLAKLRKCKRDKCRQLELEPLPDCNQAL